MEQCDKYITVIKKYLNDKSIAANGFLENDMQQKNEKSLIYVAYVVENFSSNPKLEQKVKLLASERGDTNNKNDIKRNYYNQLVEFHALYVFTKLIGFNFIDFDIPSNKKYADQNKNCDLCIEKNNSRYFADAKDLSGEIMSAVEKDVNGNKYELYTPAIPEALEGWLKGYIANADKKGADFLIVHIPTWDLFDAEISNLYKFHQRISKNIILNESKFFWNIPNTMVDRIIFVKAFGFWEIEITH